MAVVGTFIAVLGLLSLLACGDNAMPAPSAVVRPSMGGRGESQALPGAPAPEALSLRWMSTEYFVGGPGDPVIELRIIVGNDDRRGRNTDSTTILWEPSFAQHTTFLSSDPPAWRVRVDEQGWGVLDTAGVLGQRRGTFRLWFTKGDDTVYEPRVKVVANGDIVIAETDATPSHRRRGRLTAAQTVFERGPLALVADAAGILPGDGRGAFHLGAGIGVLLIGAAATGGLAALRLSSRFARPY